MSDTDTDTDAIADEMLALLGSGRSVAPLTSRHPGFDLGAAYEVSRKIWTRRQAAGEVAAGRKIGFTNRTLWDAYGVHAPILGFVYDTTLHDLAARTAPFDLSRMQEPRIEPEIVFGLKAAPKAGMTPEELLACCAWVAHGFEIVQSVYPGWKFQAPDTVAAFGLHAALLVGPKHQIGGDGAAWQKALARFEVELLKDGVVERQGRGANVLDSPLLALKHAVDALAELPAMPPFAAGEVVTTGTLTDALPVKAGETWSTRLSGIALEPASIRF